MFTAIIPEMTLLGLLCVILMTDLFLTDKTRWITYSLTQLTLVVVAVLAALQWGHPTVITFSGDVIRDDLSSVLKVFICVFVLLALIYARSYNRSRELDVGEFYVLTLASTLGMMVLVSAGSFITLYLGVELVSLPLYALVAMRRSSALALEAAIKYIVTGALASGLLLYGLSILYGLSGGHLVLTDVAEGLSKCSLQTPLLLGMVFVAIGLMFKLGAVPFHLWVPDVYQGAPTSVVALLTSAPKLAAFAMIVRLLAGALPSLISHWQVLLSIVAVLSMFFGNLVAITQTNLKRLFAYSSIAHMGYLLLGIVAGSAIGYAAAMVYSIVYALMALGGFGMLAVLSQAGFEMEKINDFRGLNSRQPWLAFLFLLLLFSMAGIPPTVGFFAKLGVIEALLRAHQVWLACVAVLFSVIGVYYYLRVVKVMYFEEPTEHNAIPISIDGGIALSVNAIAVLLLGLFPSQLISLCRMAFGV